jgi:hypothetical protein
VQVLDVAEDPESPSNHAAGWASRPGDQGVFAMRAFDGQRSDKMPVKRDAAAKRVQLQKLRERLASMRSHESPALRSSIESSIKRLETELASERR